MHADPSTEEAAQASHAGICHDCVSCQRRQLLALRCQPQNTAGLQYLRASEPVHTPGPSLGSHINAGAPAVCPSKYLRVYLRELTPYSRAEQKF